MLGGWPQPPRYPTKRSHSLLCFPSYLPPSKPKKQPAPRKPHPWPTSHPAPPRPEWGCHRTKAPQVSSRGSWLGRAALTGAGTHLQRTFPGAEPIFLPKLSDVVEEGSFRASPGVTGTLYDECPQAAPLRPSTGAELPLCQCLPLPAAATTCLIMRILTSLGSDRFHKHSPATSLPSHVLARGDPATRPGSATRVPRNTTVPQNAALPPPQPPSQLQATVGARLWATAPQTSVCHGACATSTHTACAKAKANRAP